MNELTFADLMAIDYWKRNGKSIGFMANKLGMTRQELMFSAYDKKLQWAVGEINIYLNQRDLK
jgi:hypothetical protein